MKRLLFVALALSCFCGSASAQTTALSTPKWEYGVGLDFRTLDSGNTLDSAYATGAATRADTTVAFLFAQVWTPSTGIIASDSTEAMLVHLDPIATTGLTLTADTIYATIQVSMDQSNWLTAQPVTAVGSQAAYNISGTNRVGQPILESASGNCFAWVVRQKYTALAARSLSLEGTAPNWSTMWGWRYVRFIIGHANTGKFRLSVDYPRLAL